MKRFFIKHKLSVEDITYLSDSDSELVINHLKLKIENFVEIETYESIFLAVISNISKSSVEVQVLEKIQDKDVKDTLDITIVQSLISKDKFNYLIEKSVELGIDMIIPVESKYSSIDRNRATKEYGLWQKIIKDATEQSRNIKPTIIEKPIKLEDLQIEKDSNSICLSTENTDLISLSQYINSVDINKPFTIAIGPEKGWSSQDIKKFKDLGFTFIKLKGNILRTESVGLIIGSIIKYLKGDI